MNKMQMAHDCALAYIKYGDGKTHYKDVVEFAWQYADAMQAEADKRKPSGLPDALKEEWQPDWSQAPKEYPVTGWYIFKGVAHWISDDFPCGPAPSFGFTGSLIVERPNGF